MTASRYRCSKARPSIFKTVSEAIRNAGLACTSVTVLPDEAHSAISPDPASRQGAVDHI